MILNNIVTSAANALNTVVHTFIAPPLGPFQIQVHLRTAHNKFVCANDNGTIVANRDTAGPWETFIIVPYGGSKVAFRTCHNKYLSALPDGGIHGNAPTIQAWETFDVEIQQGDKFAFRSHHGKYLCAEGNLSIVCNRNAPPQAWEQFSVHVAHCMQQMSSQFGVTCTPPHTQLFGSCATVTIKSSQQKFICAEGDGKSINANRDQASAWETFTASSVSGLGAAGKYSFRSAHGKFLCAEDKGGKVTCDRTSARAWEHWEVVRLSPSTYALRSAHGKFLSAEPNGRLVADRDVIGAWEQFSISVAGVPGGPAQPQPQPQPYYPSQPYVPQPAPYNPGQPAPYVPQPYVPQPGPYNPYAPVQPIVPPQPYPPQPQPQPYYPPQPQPQRCQKCSGKGNFDAFGKPCDRTSIHFRTACATCNGSGMSYLSIPCPRCGAKGAFGPFGACEQGSVHAKSPCPLCQGKCFVDRQYTRCQQCQGKGNQGAFGPCELYDVHKRSECQACAGRGFFAF